MSYRGIWRKFASIMADLSEAGASPRNPGFAAKALAVLHHLEDALLVLLVLSLLGIAAYQVIARNFFDGGIVWGDSLVRIMVFWVTMVGAMLAARRNEHIRIDAVTRLLSPTANLWVQRLSNLFCAAMCGLLAYYSYQFVAFEYADKTIAFASVPSWICESVLPFGAGVLCLRYCIRTIAPQ